jgi:hypothetical protein
MLAYPNREIFTICSHEEYEKIMEAKRNLIETKEESAAE